MNLFNNGLTKKLAEHATSLTAVSVFLGGLLVFIGWDLPPFASMARTKTIEDAQKDMSVTQAATACIMLKIERTTLGLAYRNAESDTKKFPESESAAEALRETKEALRTNRQNIRALGVRCPI